jgi:hypothetical protein
LLRNQNFKQNSAQKFIRKLVLAALCNRTAAQISNKNKLIEI